MRTQHRILVLCRQSLKNVQSAVRAYNMYRSLAKLGCKITYLDGWKPAFKLSEKNLEKWLALLSFKRFNKTYSRVFVENVQAYFVSKILKKLNMPIVLDVRDDHNLHAQSMGITISEKIFLEQELAFIENFETAQRILLTSNSYADYYSKKYRGQFDEKFLVVMNASDPYRFRNEPLPEDPRIGILGGANWGAGFDLLCKAARIVKEAIPDLSVHVGYKYLPQTASYVNIIRQNYKEEWLNFYENIGYTTNAPEFYSSMYLCVIPRKKTVIHEMSVPSKIFDCMASARPLVVTNCKEQARIVEEENCGLVCDFTSEDMAKKIIKLIRNRKLAQDMGQRARKIIEAKHNWQHRAHKIVTDIFMVAK